MLKSSLEWSELETKLVRKANTLPVLNARDVRKLLGNITHSVSELSKAEVEARRGKPHRAEELLSKINQDIEMVEEYLVVATLLG